MGGGGPARNFEDFAHVPPAFGGLRELREVDGEELRAQPERLGDRRDLVGPELAGAAFDVPDVRRTESGEVDERGEVFAAFEPGEQTACFEANTDGPAHNGDRKALTGRRA